MVSPAGFEPTFRNLNHRDSALRSSLVSVDLTSDEIPATGGRQRFALTGRMSESLPAQTKRKTTHKGWPSVW